MQYQLEIHTVTGSEMVIFRDREIDLDYASREVGAARILGKRAKDDLRDVLKHGFPKLGDKKRTKVRFAGVEVGTLIRKNTVKSNPHTLTMYR